MQPSASGSGRDLAILAREIIDANRYMTLATADGDGRPWAAPVWYAHRGYTDFLWCRNPETRHSRNLASRPEVAPDGLEVQGRDLARDSGCVVTGHRMEATLTLLPPARPAL
jgi:hypothetical protein